MKKIVLISCVSRKRKKKAKAKDLYQGPLFTYSLLYAQNLNPDRIFILSALYHLVDLDQEIEPYDITLSYVSPRKKANTPKLKVLNKNEAKVWGEKVLDQLRKVTDLDQDLFIFLAGQSYLTPIKHAIANVEEPLKGLKQGERVQFLKRIIG